MRETETNEAIIHYEILEEKAHSLGRAARQVEQALQSLRRHDENLHHVSRGAKTKTGTSRDELIAEAAEKAHYFLILRELCGFRDWPDVAEFYSIPNEVLKRMGSHRTI